MVHYVLSDKKKILLLTFCLRINAAYFAYKHYPEVMLKPKHIEYINS